MSTTAREQELFEKFSDEYRRGQSPVMLDLERAVCGCDYGGTSWTTREEAESIGRLLDLREGRRLLEIGSGSGWPSLYLASRSGCDVTLTDVPGEALRIAAGRASRDTLGGRIAFVLASGAALPFEAGCFDAVNHSDVLCCLPDKRKMLGECRRVARDRTIMVFTVISIAPNLDPGDRACAIESGPPFVDSDCGYPELLRACGWCIETRKDITAAYEDTGKRHLRGVQMREGGLVELLGAAEYEDLLMRRRRNVSAVERRILRRELYAVKRR